jgi:DNA-binding transcriptional LysR family regulator
MMALELRQLRYFVAVAEEGQITRAAAKLHIAQPALSQAITQLESRLGVLLFARHPRGVSVLPAAEVLLEKAQSALLAMSEADHVAESLARGSREVVELGFLGFPPAAHAPELFKAFATSHPESKVNFRELPFPTGTTRSWIGGVDVALCHPPAIMSGVGVQPLRAEPRTVIVARSHRLAQRTMLDVAEVVDQTFLGYHPAIDRAWAGFWNLDDHRGAPAPRLTAERVLTPIEMLSTIAAGEAVTTLPSCHAAAIVDILGGIVAIPLRDARPAVLSLVWQRDSRNSAAQEFLLSARSFAENDAAERLRGREERAAQARQGRAAAETQAIEAEQLSGSARAYHDEARQTDPDASDSGHDEALAIDRRSQ